MTGFGWEVGGLVLVLGHFLSMSEYPTGAGGWRITYIINIQL